MKHPCPCASHASEAMHAATTANVICCQARMLGFTVISCMRFAAYPEELPCVQLLEAKGLGDDRQHALLQTLHAETHGMAGHPVLGLLAETARAFLTDNNHPEGDCAFCLLPMEAAAAAQGAVAASSHDDAPVCMPCFHAFHVGCYLQWWAWRQRDLAAEEAQLRAHTGAAATAAIASVSSLSGVQHACFGNARRWWTTSAQCHDWHIYCMLHAYYQPCPVLSLIQRTSMQTVTSPSLFEQPCCMPSIFLASSAGLL